MARLTFSVAYFRTMRHTCLLLCILLSVAFATTASAQQHRSIAEAPAASGRPVPAGLTAAPGRIPVRPAFLSGEPPAGRRAAVPPDSLPPIQPLRVAGEVGLGVLTGGLGGLAGGVAGASVWVMRGAPVPGENGCSSRPDLCVGALVAGNFYAHAFVGFLVGYGLGVPSGVHLVGNTDRQGGARWAVILGSLTATGAGLVGLTAYQGGAYPGWLGTIQLLGPPVLATVGFQLTRHRKQAGRASALLEYEEGTLELSVPSLVLAPLPTEAGGPAGTIRLAVVRF